jgi:plastocyanin
LNQQPAAIRGVLLRSRVRLKKAETIKRLFVSAPCALAFAAGVLTAAIVAAVAAPQVVISQKGREFRPGEVSIARGATIQIMNDDGDLLHHAYIDSPKFSFDSGDQQPGSKTNITFVQTGDFAVRCAIHPKMKLLVHVK